MDLLQSYGSSSEDEDEEKNSVAAQEEKPAFPTGAALSKPSPLSTTDIPATTITTSTQHSTLAGSSSSATTSDATTQQRHGKRLLSLQAVLPPHIFDQLTRHQPAAGADDDDDDDEPVRQKSPSVTASSRAQTTTVTRDRGLDNLWKDLQQARPQQRQPAASLSLKRGGGALEKNNPSSKVAVHELLSTTTTTITTVSSSKAPPVVVDIHAKDPPTMATTIGENDDASSSPVGDSIETEIHPRVVRGSRPRMTVQAAPPVPQRWSSLSHEPDDAPIPQPPPDNTVDGAPPASTSATTTNLRKQRQELERRLRQRGENLHDVTAGANFIALRQADPRANAEQLQQQQQQQELLQQEQYGIRAVAAPMYDPSAGQAVTGLKRGRGKNQIHHLVRSAADLELARARGMATAGSQVARTHRANAKRKYGW